MVCVPNHCRPAGGRADNPLIHRLTAIHAGVRPYGIDGCSPEVRMSRSPCSCGWYGTGSEALLLGDRFHQPNAVQPLMGGLQRVVKGWLQCRDPRLAHPPGHEFPVVRPISLGRRYPVTEAIQEKTAMEERAGVDLVPARAPACDRLARHMKGAEGEAGGGAFRERTHKRPNVIWRPPVVIVQIGNQGATSHRLQRMVPRNRVHTSMFGHVPVSQPRAIDTRNNVIDKWALVTDHQYLDIRVGLSQRAGDCSLQEFGPVARGDNHTDEWRSTIRRRFGHDIDPRARRRDWR